MLPDYPKIKIKIQKKLTESVKKRIQAEPLLSQIRVRIIHEGDVLTSSSIDGYTESTEYKLLSTRLEIPKEEIIDEGPNAFFSRVDKIAKEMAKQQSQLLFKRIDEVTERTGHIVDAKSKPLSPQVILEALEKIAIDFDEYGNPIFPTLVLHPDQYEKIKDEIPKWESDPELRKRHTELIEKKRKEWIDRKSRRKLVD